ncbi:hypothetical protein HanIR_Chr10g0473141 [Helianthus annuus]|nr:hypothetical protein HanIR_Chr10g0473141 [Helianthus annuus]
MIMIMVMTMIMINRLKRHCTFCSSSNQLIKNSANSSQTYSTSSPNLQSHWQRQQFPNRI